MERNVSEGASADRNGKLVVCAVRDQYCLQSVIFGCAMAACVTVVSVWELLDRWPMVSCNDV